MIEVVKIVGLRSWGAKIGIGTHLTLELGDEWATKKNRPRGEWSIWVSGAPWCIISKGVLVVGSGSDDLSTERVEILNARTLKGIFFQRPTYSTVFEFAEGVKLEVFIDTPDGNSELVVMSETKSYFLNGSGKVERD